MIYSLKDSEETIKNKVRQDFFADYDGTQCFDNIDFSVAVREEGTFVLPEREYLLWAESKAGNKHSLFDSLVQLILTIGKARTLDNALPPHFLGAFDAEKIAFIPFSAVMQVFALNDFNWNVTPSDHASKEFKLLHQLVKQQIQEHAAQDGQVYICSFQNDEKELRQFIRRNFVSGRDKIQRIRVNHNNFVTIFQKWRREVMPTINVNWDNAKKNNLLDADFFLADLIAENNRTLLDNLHVLLQDTHYELDRHIDTDRLFTSKQVQFSDHMIAHSRFWTRYARPPKQIYWDKIVERRDLLVPQDVRERKGSCFTPAIWVGKSQEYLEKLLGENWQEEYYIWDCCAGFLMPIQSPPNSASTIGSPLRSSNLMRPTASNPILCPIILRVRYSPRSRNPPKPSSTTTPQPLTAKTKNVKPPTHSHTSLMRISLLPHKRLWKRGKPFAITICTTNPTNSMPHNPISTPLSTTSGASSKEPMPKAK